MIVHTITPYKEPTPPPPAVYPVTRQEGYVPFGGGHLVSGRVFYGIDTKIGYSRYLESLTMKVGDFIVPKKSAYPFEDHVFYRVDDVNQLYYTANWNRERTFPLCLYVTNCVGQRLWVCPEDFFKVFFEPSSDWGKRPAIDA